MSSPDRFRRAALRGALYFAFVFAAGFVLGAIRVTWVVPRLGERTAELVEAPLMLAVSFLCARLVVRRHPASSRTEHLASGALALVLMIVFEFTVVLGLRGLTLEDYLASRDPVAGTVYAAALAAFALMPWLVAKSPRRRG